MRKTLVALLVVAAVSTMGAAFPPGYNPGGPRIPYISRHERHVRHVAWVAHLAHARHLDHLKTRHGA
jgi:hypothetical protein